VTKKPNVIKLDRRMNEEIVAVVPQNASGPGWHSSPTWVFIADCTGTIRRECIQPSDRSPRLAALWHIGEVVARALICSVEVEVGDQKNA
jgi:hypothetical protein